jgi:hypothetical protein
MRNLGLYRVIGEHPKSLAMSTDNVTMITIAFLSFLARCRLDMRNYFLQIGLSYVRDINARSQRLHILEKKFGNV